MEINTSHDYAKQLREIADALLDLPAFQLPRHMSQDRVHDYLHYFSDKERFVAAAKALGNFEKGVRDDALVLSPLFSTHFQIRADRSSVCRLVRSAQPAEYECEPLLSQAEEAAIA